MRDESIQSVAGLPNPQGQYKVETQKSLGNGLWEIECRRSRESCRYSCASQISQIRKPGWLIKVHAGHAEVVIVGLAAISQFHNAVATYLSIRARSPSSPPRVQPPLVLRCSIRQRASHVREYCEIRQQLAPLVSKVHARRRPCRRASPRHSS